MIHTGSCHCGAVLIEVEAPEDVEVYECNCSMCERTGFQHLIVPAHRFRLVRGQESLASYTFNTGVAKHLFCRVCGVKPFYVPRSNPDGFSVNLRCLDRSTIRSVKIAPFDGRNWEANAGTLADLSKPD
ncbi:MAG TPA: GFA family protein [Burkholderiales bacterium]|nr:GFA family protein [Burkholderiales bacterium]